MNTKDVVVITGAAGSIGKALCKKFSQQGYSIAAFDINCAQLKSLNKSINIDPKSFLSLELDVTNYESVLININHVRNNLGKIKVVINNAGKPFSNSFSDTTKETWKADIDLNLNAAYYLFSAVIPDMINSGGGSIVNIGSINGINIYGHPGYSAAKAALIHLTKFIAVEFGKFNIRSNIICPGTVNTNAWTIRLKKNPKLFNRLKELYPTNSIIKPEDIANLVLFITSQDAYMINGSNIIVDGGLTVGISEIISEFIQTKF